MSKKRDITEAVIEELELNIKLEQAMRMWFWPDYKQCENLRLTKPGLSFVQRAVKPYAFDFDFTQSGNMLKRLAKLNIPFYVDREGIVIFSADLASMITLYGSFDRYLELINQ